MHQNEPTYLQPYLRAARSHGDGFRSLLWASPRSQAARFDALMAAVAFNGRTVCDAGCGRADLLDHLVGRRVLPLDYVGIEAVDELATAAERKERSGVRILRGDFISDPVRLFIGAEIVVFCGSLNTVDDDAFYRTLRRAFDATAWTLVFNFLSSPVLAAASHLYWRHRNDVERYVQTFGAKQTLVLADYMEGDCTIAVSKVDPHDD